MPLLMRYGAHPGKKHPAQPELQRSERQHVCSHNQKANPWSDCGGNSSKKNGGNPAEQQSDRTQRESRVNPNGDPGNKCKERADLRSGLKINVEILKTHFTRSTSLPGQFDQALADFHPPILTILLHGV